MLNLYLSCTPPPSQTMGSIEDTVCPKSSDPFYKVSYFIKWVTTSWTHSIWKILISANEKLCKDAQEETY